METKGKRKGDVDIEGREGGRKTGGKEETRREWRTTDRVI